MANNTEHLISLNGEYLYSSANGGKFAPLRVTEKLIKKVQKEIDTTKPNECSCIKKLYGIWCDGRFLLGTDFNETTKCTVALSGAPSHRIKSEMCLKKLCNGECTDDFLRHVLAKNILPELYNTKQK